MKDDYIDIDYSGKINNKYTIEDVYSKIQNYIKRNKLDKICMCQKESNCIIINFNDNVSDAFILDMNKNTFEGYCRISYDKSLDKSTLEKLLDMLFSIKCIFSKLDINDDYSICKSYLKNKSIKIKLLELNEEEIKRVMSICDEGYSNYKIFLLTCIARDLNVKSYEELYINYDISKFMGCETIEEVYEEMVLHIFETWLYETTEYKNEGRFYNTEFYNKNNQVEYLGLGATAFDMYAFCNGMLSIISNNNRNKTTFGMRDAQVKRFYVDKIFLMLQQESDKYQQCIIAYRYLISILDYTGFKFVGKDKKSDGNKHYTKVKYQDNNVFIRDSLNYFIREVI